MGRPYRAPSDQLEHALAEILLKPGEERERLTAGMYLPKDRREKVCLLDDTLQLVVETRPLREKLRVAVRGKTLHAKGAAQIDEAVEKGVLTAFEAESLKAAEVLRREAIKVDDFPKL
jgi:acyl-CoA dehydrogenase